MPSYVFGTQKSKVTDLSVEIDLHAHRSKLRELNFNLLKIGL